jgi:hypothetical protein
MQSTWPGVLWLPLWTTTKASGEPFQFNWNRFGSSFLTGKITAILAFLQAPKGSLPLVCVQSEGWCVLGGVGAREMLQRTLFSTSSGRCFANHAQNGKLTWFDEPLILRGVILHMGRGREGRETWSLWRHWSIRTSIRSTSHTIDSAQAVLQSRVWRFLVWSTSSIICLSCGGALFVSG